MLNDPAFVLDARGQPIDAHPYCDLPVSLDCRTTYNDAVHLLCQLVEVVRVEILLRVSLTNYTIF